jgi:hypothetical protein
MNIFVLDDDPAIVYMVVHYVKNISSAMARLTVVMTV